VVERRRCGGDRHDDKGKRPRKEGEGRKDERLAAAAAVAGCGGGRRRSSMDGPTEETEAELSVLSSRGVALESLEEGRKITKTPIQFRNFCQLKHFSSPFIFFLSSFLIFVSRKRAIPCMSNCTKLPFEKKMEANLQCFLNEHLKALREPYSNMLHICHDAVADLNVKRNCIWHFSEQVENFHV